MNFQREMKRGEEAEVEALLRAAFGGEDEAKLVRQLRKSGAMAGEMVVPDADGIIGYYALSKMVAPKGWLALAPVAVAPEHQGRGVGRRMVGMCAEWARIARAHVVVLGDVRFYERAGFSHARAAQLRAPYPVEHLALAGPEGDAPEVELVYAKAFGG